jgi:hypothetical protein
MAKSIITADEVISRNLSKPGEKWQTGHLRHRTVDNRKKPESVQRETHKAEGNLHARNLNILASREFRSLSGGRFALL